MTDPAQAEIAKFLDYEMTTVEFAVPFRLALAYTIDTDARSYGKRVAVSESMNASNIAPHGRKLFPTVKSLHKRTSLHEIFQCNDKNYPRKCYRMLLSKAMAGNAPH